MCKKTSLILLLLAMMLGFTSFLMADTNRSIDFSDIIVLSPDYVPGTTMDFEFELSVDMTGCWLTYVELDFPTGVTVNSATNISGIDWLNPTGETGDGIVTTWGAPGAITYGYVVSGNYVFDVNVDIDSGFSGDLLIDYFLETDHWGSPPHTASGTITIAEDAPFLEEDFSDGVLPAGWQNIELGDPGYAWEFDPGLAYIDSDAAGSGNYVYGRLTTPELDLSDADNVTLAMNHYYRHSSSVAKIRISTDGVTWHDAYTFTANEGGTGYPLIEYDISAWAAGEPTVYIDFYYNDNDAWAWYWRIDNIEVFEPSPAPLPAVLVSPDDGSTDVPPFVSLNWEAGGGAAPTGYKIYLGTDDPPTNIENGTDLGDVTTYNPDPNLDYNTEYFWQIVPYNDEGDAVDCPVWSFTTGPDPTLIAPHFEDFDDVSTPDLPYGWSKIVEHPTSTSPRVETYTWGTPLSPPNHVRLYSNDEQNADIMLITPPAVDLAQSRIRFWAKCSYSTNIPDLIIGTMSNPTDVNTFTPFQIIEADTELTGTYQEFIVHFDGYVGTDQYIVFKHGATPSFFRSIYIDDFTYEEIPTDPVLEVSPMEHNFGAVVVGDMPDPVDFTLTNAGVGILTIYDGDILFTGTDPDDFALGAITYPIEIESGNSETIPVMLDPQTPGSKEAMMQITHNGTNSPFDVGPLSGEALPEGSLVEGFEDEFPPEDWTYIDGGVGSYWEQSGTSPYAGNYSARSYNGFASNYYADEWLVTPMLDLDATPEPTLLFAGRSAYSRPDPSMTIRIMMLDEVYDNVDDLHANAIEVDNIVLTTTWTEYEVDLSVYSGFHYLAFLYYVEDGSFNYVYVDEVAGPPKYYPPVFSYDPQEFDFGGLSVGRVSEPQDFILSNIGGDVITIAPEDIYLTGDADHFILNNIEQTVNLEADESVTVSVQFAPQSLEDKEAFLNIEDNIAADRNLRVTRADQVSGVETGRELHTIPLQGEGLMPFRVERITPDELIVVGESFIYEVDIINDTESDELFHLLTLGGSWGKRIQNAGGGLISTITVPAEETSQVYIRVTAPIDASEGDEEIFTFRAYSQTNPELTDEVEIISIAVEPILPPYVQNFQSDEFPPEYWRTENWAWSATHGIAGSGAAIVPQGTDETAILRTKPISLPDGEKHVRFWWADIDPTPTRQTSTTYLEIAPQADVLPNPGTGEWTVLETLESGSYNAYTEMMVDLTAYEAGDYYLRWRHEPNGTSPGAGLARVIIEANVPAAEFTITPDAYDYGEVLVGESEIAQFTVTNLGLETMTISDGGIYIEALQRISRDQHYNVVHPDYPVNLEYMESFELEVMFEPLTDGIHEAELVIENNITRAVNRVPLIGEGYFRPAGSTCDNPYIAALPIVDYEDNTEAYGDDYSSGWIDPSSNYLNGNDFVVQFDIDELGILEGSVSGSWTGLFILDQCPSETDPPDVLASATGSSGGSLSVEDLPIGTYYAIVSTWPSPQFTDFTLNLSLVTGPVFAVDPPEKDFGQILVDATSDDQVFTISNAGIDTLIVNSIDLIGDDADQFQLTDDNLYPIGLGAGENATVSVAFAPTSEGIKTAMLEITESEVATERIGSGRDTTLHQVPLMGEGFDPTVTQLPWEEGFENLFPPVGWTIVDGITGSHWRHSTVSHTGNHSAQAYQGASSSPSNTADEWLITPPVDLDEIGNVILSFYGYVSRPPDGAKEKMRVLILDQLYDNVADLHDNAILLDEKFFSQTWEEYSVNLAAFSGTKYIAFNYYITQDDGAGFTNIHIDDVALEEIPTEPVFAVEPDDKDFGTITVGQTSEDEVFTISNEGGGTLTLNSIALGGDNVGEFVLTDENTYPLELGTGQTAIVSVAFAPQSAGMKTATLDITEAQNVPDRLGRSRETIVHQVPLSGEGYAPPPGIVLDEDFTDVPVGDIPSGWTTTHTNWSVQNSSNAGGEAPEMRFNWSPSATAEFRLATSALDVSDADGLVLEFKHMVNNFSSPGIYDLKVQASTDGTTWSDMWVIVDPDDIPAETVTIDFAGYAGESELYIAWVLDGDSYDINQWYIDDILLIEPLADGFIQGQVALIGGDGRLADVEVTAGDITVNPESDGTYSIEIAPGTYDVTAELFGYQTEVQYGVEVMSDEITPDINFDLGNIGIAVAPSSFDVFLDHGTTLTQPMTISNDGAGDLEYEIGIVYNMPDRRNSSNHPSSPFAENQKPHNSEFDEKVPATMQTVHGITQPSRGLFDLLNHFPTGTGVGYSVATDGYYIYSAMWNNNLFYKYETDGTYVGEFSIAGFDGNLRDMTYDGQYFYGSPNSDTIYQLDLVNEILVDQFTTNVSSIRGIAYDENNDGFWITNGWNPPITLVDRNGSTIQTINPTIGSISGLGWDKKSDDGPHLWAYTQPGSPSDNVLNKINIEDETIVQTFDLAVLGILDDESISGGMDIASETGAWTIIGMSQNDVIWVLDLDSWLSIEPIAGTVPAGQSEVVDLTFDATRVVASNQYSADLVITNNAGDNVVIPATMDVGDFMGALPPYLVDFEAEFPPVHPYGPDWQRMAGAFGTELQPTIYGWQQMDFANLGEGNMSAGIQMYDNNLNHWLITSPIYLDSGARNEGVYRLNFDLALTQFNRTTGASLAEGDIFRVYITADDGVTWDMLKQWDHTTPIPADGEPQLLLLEGYDGETAKFGFYAESDVINDVELFVDNFAVRYVGEAVYDINPLAHNFERVNLGETEEIDINLDLTEGTLIINNIELHGEDADEFMIPELHYPMAIDDSAALPVTFAPVVLGLKSAQIDIEIYDPYAVTENGEYYTYEVLLDGVGYEEPTLTPPEHVEFAENEEWQADFTDYITGITPGGELPVLTVEETDDIIVTIDGYEVTISAPANWNGIEDVTFIVDDQFIDGLVRVRNSEYVRRENPISRATDSFTIEVEVTPVNNPPFVIEHVADFEIDINQIDDTTVNLWDVFDDWDLHPELNNHPDAPDEVLTFSAEGNENIAVDIDQETGEVTFTPATDWYGAEEITLTATDIENQTAETTFTVTVPNEPPYVENLVIDAEDDWVKVGHQLTASYTFIDPDGHEEGESTYQWYRQSIARTSRNNWIAIEGANELEYTLTTEDAGKLIVFGVTPVDQYGLAGDEQLSEVLGPVDPLSDDATLAEITVDEVPIVGFSPDIYEYTMYYSFGTTDVPVVDAVANNDFADIIITEADEMPYNHHEDPTFTTIDVYAEDGIHELTYTVYFAITPADNANLASITLEYGTLDPSFDPDITEYTGILPYDSTMPPVVTATTQDPGATHTVTDAIDLEDTTVIHVVSLDGTVEKYYYVDYMLEPSLATLEVSMGELEPEFDPGINDYDVVLPFGTTDVPTLTATATLEGSTIDIVEPTELPERHFEDPAMAYIEVTHPEGYPTNTYSVAYSIAPNTVATLDDIEVDGVSIPDFDPETLEYTIELPYGTTEVPELTVYTTDEYATYEITDAEELPERWFDDPTTSIVEVTAEDGETILTYEVNFAILPNTVATLDDIEVDGESIPEFDPDVYEYDLYYVYGSQEVPEVVVETTDPMANATIVDADEMPGTTEVTVVAEDDETELIYTLNFIWEENQAPYIENLVITGYHKVGHTLTAEYDFFDPDGHAEGETLYQWYVSAPASREPMTPIEGAVEDTFMPTMDYVGMNILVEVTPVDEWYLAGEAVLSAPTDPIIPLDPPRNLVANAGDEYVDLMWQAPITTRGEGRRSEGRISENRDYRDDHAVIGYNIYRDEELITTVGVVHIYRDEGLENVVEYSYYVTALYPAGESFPSNTDTAMPMPDIIPYGDVDNNGVVEAFDAALTLQYAVGLDPLPEDPRPWEDWRQERADVDANSYIQAYDASLIIRYALGIITEFPAQQEPGRLADPIYVDISYAVEDGYLYFVTNAMEDLFAAEFIIPHPANVSFGEVEFNPILADYITAVHTDDQAMHIALAAAIPEEGADYLLRIPYEQEDYELLTIDVISNIHEFSMEIEFDPTESDIPIAPVSTMLSQNYPNPFNPNTTIAFALQSQQHVRIEVYSIKGKKVATLVDETMASGYHTVNWNGTDERGRTLASGIYLYRMVTEDFSATKKMIYLK